MAMTAIGRSRSTSWCRRCRSSPNVLRTDVATVQLTLSLYLLGLAVAQLVIGPLSDRFGRRPVVLGGTCARDARAPRRHRRRHRSNGLILARILQALGASTGIVVGRAIIRDLYERDRAASMIGLVTTVMVVAPMFAPAHRRRARHRLRLAIDFRLSRRSFNAWCWSGRCATLAGNARPSPQRAPSNVLHDWRALLRRPALSRLHAVRRRSAPRSSSSSSAAGRTSWSVDDGTQLRRIRPVVHDHVDRLHGRQFHRLALSQRLRRRTR